MLSIIAVTMLQVDSSLPSSNKLTSTVLSLLVTIFTISPAVPGSYIVFTK